MTDVLRMIIRVGEPIGGSRSDHRWIETARSDINERFPGKPASECLSLEMSRALEEFPAWRSRRRPGRESVAVLLAEVVLDYTIPIADYDVSKANMLVGLGGVRNTAGDSDHEDGLHR